MCVCVCVISLRGFVHKPLCAETFQLGLLACVFSPVFVCVRVCDVGSIMAPSLQRNTEAGLAAKTETYAKPLCACASVWVLRLNHGEL